MNGAYVSSFTSNYQNQDIIVGVDSSKTNTAIYVLDSQGEDLDYYEIQGFEDKDVLLLCYLSRKELSRLFKGANIIYFGIEDIITKKNEGLNMHQTRFKITAVFMSIICCIQDNFKITPELVNNKAWKAAVLPEEYRRDEHKKGSKDWLIATGHKLAYCKDDVTDAYCIALFMKLKHGVVGLTKIEHIQSPTTKYKTTIQSKESLKGRKVKMFLYNADFTLQQNTNFMSNNIQKSRCGACEIITSKLTPEFIYSSCEGSFNRVEQTVFIVVEI